MVTPVQQAAVDDITRKLDSSGWFEAVTHDEMNQIADRLKGLSATDADAVIDELQRTGQLDKLAGEAVDGDWFGNGGYSADERRDLFNDLAGKLDGQSLAAVSNAFAKTDDGADGHARVGELGDAVAKHATGQVKLQYVEAMKGQVSDRPSWTDSGLMSSTGHTSDAEAAAVGKVLTSLKGSVYADDAFKALDPKQLRSVMEASIDEKMTSTAGMGGGSHSVTWNANGFRDLMDAAATIPDADLKARIFDAGADTLRGVRETSGFMGRPAMLGKDDTMKVMAEGLTKIIDSDTTGVIRELAYNQETMDGSDLATYSRQLMESGQEKKLGEIMAKLQMGNGQNEDPFKRLDQVTQVPVAGGNAQDRRENAGALGYFVGSVYAGAQSWSKDVAKQQEVVTSILDSALTIIDKARISEAVGTIASVGKEWTHYAVRAAIQDPGTGPATRLERAALPINPATGELGVGDNIRNAFNTTLSQVQRTAEP